MKIITFLFLLFSFLVSSTNTDIFLKLNTFMWKTNWDKHSINYYELNSAGPPKDGIASIDSPHFIKISDAKMWLKDNEPLIFVKIGKYSKAYPLQVLIWHEIVNDSLNNNKILVTFCPLCNASIVFNRTIKHKVYEFGTSGLLRKSDLVMYDRQTESLWQQFTGEAIVGDMTKTKLKKIPSSIVSFKHIYENYPNTKILSKKTGFDRNYGKNPYVGYDDINTSPFLFQDIVDDRLKPMRRVATIKVNKKFKAYSYKKLKKIKVLNDDFENKKLVLFYFQNINSALDKKDMSKSQKSGTVQIFNRKVKNLLLDFYFKDGFFYDKQTNSKWNIFGKAVDGKLKGKKLKQEISGNYFWFAWSAFRPNTIVFK